MGQICTGLRRLKAGGAGVGVCGEKPGREERGSACREEGVESGGEWGAPDEGREDVKPDDCGPGRKEGLRAAGGRRIRA